jgi:hypothetical protein
VKSICFLDSDAAVQRLETRRGPLHARLGLELSASTKRKLSGRDFLHLENMPVTQVMIEAVLRATGADWHCVLPHEPTLRETDIVESRAQGGTRGGGAFFSSFCEERFPLG